MVVKAIIYGMPCGSGHEKLHQLKHSQSIYLYIYSYYSYRHINCYINIIQNFPFILFKSRIKLDLVATINSKMISRRIPKIKSAPQVHYIKNNVKHTHTHTYIPEDS